MAQSLLREIEGHRQELEQPSPKFCMVRDLLRFCQDNDERLVIFSENLATLDALAHMLQVTSPAGWYTHHILLSEQQSVLCARVDPDKHFRPR